MLDCKSIDILSSRVQISPSLFCMILTLNRKFSNLLKISYIKSALVLKLIHILLYKKKYIQFLTGYVSAGFEVVYICSNKWLYPTVNFLSMHSLFLFNSVLDIVCYDLPQKIYRFSLVYVLFSIKYNSNYIENGNFVVSNHPPVVKINIKFYPVFVKRIYMNLCNILTLFE